MNRNFIGIDKEIEYLSLAQKRLDTEFAHHVGVILTQMTLHDEFKTEIDVNGIKDKTWKQIVYSALEILGGEAHLNDINAVVQQNPRIHSNPSWHSTIRRVIRQSEGITSLGKGKYLLERNRSNHQLSNQSILPLS